MHGVLICGGTGSRLRPLTDVTNKSLLPVYNRPLVLYPLDVLLRAGIRNIAVITGPEHLDQMTNFLGSGSRFGCSFTFKVQKKPRGIAQALGLAEDFADGDTVCAILGDNVYFDDLTPAIASFAKGAHVFLKQVNDPERFGVATLRAGEPAQGDNVKVLVESMEEKPLKPKTDLAVTGCYLYDARCFEVIRDMQPSPRGELEITDVSHWYLKKEQLTASILHQEWVDAGTFESLFHASNLARQYALEKKTTSSGEEFTLKKKLVPHIPVHIAQQ